MSLHSAVRSIRATVSQVAGIVYAPESVPEQINGWPAIIVRPVTGYVRQFAHATEAGYAVALGVHTVSVEVHLPWTDLELNTERITEFADLVPAALMAAFKRDQFDHTVLSLGDPRGASSSAAIRYEIGPESWGENGTNTLALKLAIDVSVEDEVLT